MDWGHGRVQQADQPGYQGAVFKIIWGCIISAVGDFALIKGSVNVFHTEHKLNLPFSNVPTKDLLDKYKIFGPHLKQFSVRQF